MYTHAIAEILCPTLTSYSFAFFLLFSVPVGLNNSEYLRKQEEEEEEEEKEEEEHYSLLGVLRRRTQKLDLPDILFALSPTKINIS